MEAQICECIDIAYERYLAITSDSEKYYLGGFGTRKYYLPLKDIIYFTTSSLPHQLIVRLTYGMYTIRGDIKNVEKKLDKRFHRCAKSYLVNTYYIRCIDKSARHLILKDGTQILMSQRGLRQLQDSLPEFVG